MSKKKIFLHVKGESQVADEVVSYLTAQKAQTEEKDPRETKEDSPKEKGESAPEPTSPLTN